ncbi:MAG: phosphoribosylformylglycinamidine synthase subunit PurL [Limnochordaceae bacterium]|nr:phosphoribosylformylglycinamidine synthase subunit PurL [Limnochordaceae bacterium]
MSDHPWRQHGMSDAEYERIVELLGRHPNPLELGLFAVLWSEHCGYKHSRRALRRFPTRGPQVLVGPGENAGVVDVGGGLAVAFRMESHNHPCAVEPYQGAATGVGGIIRDILAMGARPIALLDSLRFGPPTDPHSVRIAQGVVAGIAGYGNCVGVPTVGGEIAFDPAYAGNPLCNVVCVGVLPRNRLTRAAAHSVGNICVLVGQHTGRDGIHGATFASVELDESSESRRPSVQVGDPFREKLVIEACLEIVEQGLAAAIQDMGAAGITSSLAETAARGGTGVEVEIDAVPQREPGMTPYEVMLSESQERMLVIVEPQNVAAVQTICAKWGVQAAPIARITEDGLFTVRWHGEVVGQVPVRFLTEDVPAYDPPARPPTYLSTTRQLQAAAFAWVNEVQGRLSPAEQLLALLASPTVASKAWAYRQYDHQVQTRTQLLPGQADAALLWLKESPTRSQAIALATDGNGRLCYLDPRRGGRRAVAEAARNVACTGARPVALTNCLNFGNPDDPEIFWQFTEAIAGMSEAAEALGTPVTGGNVSFYNESGQGAIHPTPVVGMLGVAEQAQRCRGLAPTGVGQPLLLLGALYPPGWPDRPEQALIESLAGSQYQALFGSSLAGQPADVDLELEQKVQQGLLALYERGWVTAAHDCSEGGLAVTLAEMALAAGIGIRATLPDGQGRLTAVLAAFGEWPSRVVVALHERKQVGEVQRLLAADGVISIYLGETTAEPLLRLMTGKAEDWLALDLAALRQAYQTIPFARAASNACSGAVEEAREAGGACHVGQQQGPLDNGVSQGRG